MRGVGSMDSDDERRRREAEQAEAKRAVQRSLDRRDGGGQTGS